MECKGIALMQSNGGSRMTVVQEKNGGKIQISILLNYSSFQQQVAYSCHCIPIFLLFSLYVSVHMINGTVRNSSKDKTHTFLLSLVHHAMSMKTRRKTRDGGPMKSYELLTPGMKLQNYHANGMTVKHIRHEWQ